MKPAYFLSCLLLAMISFVSCKKEPAELKVLYWNIQNGMWSDQGNDYDNFVEFVRSENPDICIWAEAESRYRTDTAEKMAGCEEAYLPYNWDLLARRYGHDRTFLHQGLRKSQVREVRSADSGNHIKILDENFGY